MKDEQTDLYDELYTALWYRSPLTKAMNYSSMEKLKIANIHEQIEAYEHILERLEVQTKELDAMKEDIKAKLEKEKKRLERERSYTEELDEMIQKDKESLYEEYRKVFINFDDEQLDQIDQGITNLVDIREYANKHFSWQQMEQIREGLEGGIGAPYADPSITAEEMKRRKNNELAFMYSD